jgi:hypothetical protein
MPIENAGAMSWRDCKRDGLLPRIDFEMTGTEQSGRISRIIDGSRCSARASIPQKANSNDG